MIFKKLSLGGKMPERATKYSAGLDVFALYAIDLQPGEIAKIPTGITFENEPHDYALEWFIDLRIRSSLALKGLVLANGAGVIDADYAGKDITVLIHNTNDYECHIGRGDKIAQMIIQSHSASLARGMILKVAERTGGFGSTE